MALPKIDVPIYETKLISTGKIIKFRPFLVKEEKLFLMAAESDEPDAMILTIKQIINNCVLDEIDIDDLPIFDIENLFLNLRARSVGEIVNLKYRCGNKIVDEEGKEKICNAVQEFDVNLLEIKPTASKSQDNKIIINDNLGMVLKYPKFKSLENLISKESENVLDSDLINIVIDCIDYIYDKDNIFYAKDVQKEELVEFVDNLSRKELEQIRNFFDNMPKIKHTIDFKCNKCGHEEIIDIEGTASFFG
jgi:hypothetical protein